MRASLVYDQIFVNGRPYDETRVERPNPANARHSQDNTSDNRRHSNLNVNKLNITYLNVCGISSKLLNPDFETLINNYDILVLVETKTDEYDNIKLQIDMHVMQSIEKNLKRNRVALLLFIKKYCQIF